MKISYRVLSLALLLTLSRVGLGQTAPAPTREDSVKGQIWTNTARRVWADEKAVPPATKWATGTDFNKWVLTQPNDKAELGSLWKAVLARVGQGKPATPTQVVQAILAEVSQRKIHKTGALAKVNLQSLQVDLAPFVPAGSTTSVAVEAADSAIPAVAQPTGTSRTVAEDENPAPEVRAVPAPTYTAQPVEARYLGMPPGLAGAVLAILGALLGYGVASSRSKSKRRHRHHTSSPLAETETSPDMNPVEFRKLEHQNKLLRNELQQIKKQLAELQKRLPNAPAATSALGAPAAAAHISTTSLTAATAAAQATETPLTPAATPSTSPEMPNEAIDDTLFSVTLAVPKGTNQPVSASAGPLPAATRYGPVQETPFVEERKIVDAPLPQLALMLTVNPHNPDQATFTLNPNVDQARLIGDGLTRLQKFFDYDPPLGGRIMSVTAATPGQLQRHADGWQVVQRARLTIS